MLFENGFYNRILLKTVIGGVSIVAFSISLHEQTPIKPSLLFSYIVGHLYF